jgi:ParB family chromosome partitioning protein
MVKRQDSIQLLDIALLQPNPFQPRNKILKEELEELAASINRYGILEPLVVAHTPAGYQIVAGERRWRAGQMAGLTEIPVIIREVTRREMLEMALIENVQRVDLSALERAHSFKQLQQDFNLNLNEIADRISKSISYVSNSLRLLDLPDAIKDGLVGGMITEGHARAIMGIPSQSAMVEAYKKILAENASVRRAEEIGRLARARSGSEQTINPKRNTVYQIDDGYVQDWEDQLTKLIKAKAKVKLSRSNTQTRITITLKGSPEKTQADLEKIMKMTDPKSIELNKSPKLKTIL